MIDPHHWSGFARAVCCWCSLSSFRRYDDHPFVICLLPSFVYSS